MSRVHTKVPSEPNKKTRMAALREKFALFDDNGDGVLTRAEIEKILTRKTQNGKQMNMKMATDFCLMFQFDKIDKDGNGTIDIDEFVTALLPTVTLSVFQEYDKQGCGSVDKKELPEMLSQLSMKKGHKKHPNYASVLSTAMEETGVLDKETVKYEDFYRIVSKMNRFGESHE